MTDQFIVARDLARKSAWRVVRVNADGTRSATLGRFRKEATAQAAAYQMQVSAERRRKAPYLGD